jgi:hypothetical protein
MNHLNIAWIMAGIGILFIVACAWRNRVTGSIKAPQSENIIVEVISWLVSLRTPSQSPSYNEAPVKEVCHDPAHFDDSEQLFRLSSALHSYKPRVVTEPSTVPSENLSSVLSKG